MRLLVVGGVAAGLSAAARARRLDPSLEIVVLEAGPLISYGACGLPFFVEGRVREARQLIHYTPEYFQGERNITVRVNTRVKSIAHSRREVVLENGGRERYDRLVVATGARPFTSLPGADRKNVFTMHTVDDAVRLKTFLEQHKPTRAMIVGAGYIGLECADTLRRHGLQVAVYDLATDVLHRDDPTLTGTVKAHLERHHVELHLNAPVRAIENDPCDVVILAAGIKPNVELLAETGVEIGRTGAIRTDDRMQTNVNGIYAAGDCAEAQHLVTNRPAWIPLGTTANKMGRIAGANAAGARERFPGIVGTSIVGLFGLGVATTGLSVAQGHREGFQPVSALIEARSRPAYFDGRPTTVELVADRESRRLLGGTVLSEHDAAGRINVVATALHNQMKVDEFELLDLAYAPPFTPVWDPLLIAAQQLMKELA